MVIGSSMMLNIADDFNPAMLLPLLSADGMKNKDSQMGKIWDLRLLFTAKLLAKLFPGLSFLFLQIFSLMLFFEGKIHTCSVSKS